MTALVVLQVSPLSKSLLARLERALKWLYTDVVALVDLQVLEHSEGLAAARYLAYERFSTVVYVQVGCQAIPARKLFGASWFWTLKLF